MTLHDKVYGAGLPLVVLHGLFGSLENWHYINSQLSDTFRVFGVDQRNHGRSPHHPEMNYLAMAEDLRQFLDERGLESAHVLGHSMGGKTAMQFAMLHPRRVHRLIVVDIAPRSYPPGHREILDAMLRLDLARHASRLEMDQALTPAIPDPAVRQFLLKSVTRHADGPFHWRLNLQALSGHYSEITAGLTAERVSPVPALFIAGERSDYLRPEDEPGIRRLFPRVTFKIIPNAGHWVHAEAPVPFLNAVREFLNAP